MILIVHHHAHAISLEALYTPRIVYHDEFQGRYAMLPWVSRPGNVHLQCLKFSRFWCFGLEHQTKVLKLGSILRRIEDA